MTLMCKIPNSKRAVYQSTLDATYYEVASLGERVRLATKQCSKNYYYYLTVDTTTGSVADQVLTKTMVGLTHTGLKNVYINLASKTPNRARDF